MTPSEIQRLHPGDMFSAAEASLDEMRWEDDGGACFPSASDSGGEGQRDENEPAPPKNFSGSTNDGLGAEAKLSSWGRPTHAVNLLTWIKLALTTVHLIFELGFNK